MNETAVIADMVALSERHADDLSKDRIRATEYNRGVMKDLPAEEGRSSITTRDVRTHIKKVLPSIVRTILGGDEVVEFMPVEEGDDEGAEQAGDYINGVVIEESGARLAIIDSIHDALLLRNGILKWWFEEKQCVKFSSHTGLGEDELAQIAGDDDVEVIEQSVRIEEIDGQPVEAYDIRIKRTFVERKIRAAAVPRERFLIHPDAVTLADSLLVGEKTEIRRSDLVAMGHDPKLVDSLTLSDDDDAESDARRDVTTETTEASRANDPVDYYELYVRVDMDGDGISELRHMCFAGGLEEKHMLVNDECDEVQFCDIKAMCQPHQWEGISLADDLMDIQQVRTTLLRATNDNLYWQNNLQPIINSEAVENPDAVSSPEFGQPIELKQGFSVSDAIDFRPVPFVAKESFGMLEYMDQEAQDRTGVSDASAGLAPDALQNMTAKASAMIEQAGIGQTELMVRNIADGLKVFFRGLLRLSVRHQDRPRAVRLRGEWVTFDPRHWNADMDATVNVGLGAGTRERDMIVMQQVLAIQEKLLAAFGPDNDFVSPENLYNTVSKTVESAGLKTVSQYFTQPDPEKIKAKLEAAANKPDPEQMKLQAEMQLKQAELQMQMQLKGKEMEASNAKEAAQRDADLVVEQARMQAKAQEQAGQLQADAAIEAQRLSFEQQKHRDDMELKWAQLQNAMQTAQRATNDA